MKSKILRLFLVISVLLIGSLSTNAQIKKAHIGNWSFDAPTAPEGYTFGIVEFKKDSVFTTFMNSEYPSTLIKAKKDSIIYEVNIDGEIVLFSLKINKKLKGTGNAVWSYGETIIILTKKED